MLNRGIFKTASEHCEWCWDGESDYVTVYEMQVRPGQIHRAKEIIFPHGETFKQLRVNLFSSSYNFL